MKSLFALIPIKRMVLYIIGLAVLPIVLSYLYVENMVFDAQESKLHLTLIQNKIATKVSHQQHNRLVTERYKNTDTLFLHNKIESFPLMQEEIRSLKTLLAKSALPEDVALDRRLQSLTHTDNRCLFLETSTEVGPGYKQVIESLSKPVEMCNNDITEILTRLEDEVDEHEKEKPHLIISEAQFDRKKNPIGESWNVLLKIIRREYLP